MTDHAVASGDDRVPVFFDAPVTIKDLDAIRPTADLVCVELDPDEDTVTEGGLHVPGYTDETRTGTVVAVGPGRRSDANVLIPLDVEVGDRVLVPDRGPAVQQRIEGTIEYRKAAIYVAEEILTVLL